MVEVNKIIDKIYFDGENCYEIEKWAEGSIITSPVLEPTKDNLSGVYLQIKNKDGWITAIKGDIISRRANGDFIVKRKIK